MPLKLGDPAPNFTADTTHGMINFYEWMNNCWTVLLSHPKDFTPVCTTELLWIAKNQSEFDKRKIKIISLSVDKLIQHSKWLDDINNSYDTKINIPIIADKNMRIAKLYSMLHNDNTTARSVYIISPSKKVNVMTNYPVNTGRNFTEILRVLDSLLITANNEIATPANWGLGKDLVTSKRDAAEEQMLGYPKEVKLNINTVEDYMGFDSINDNIAC